MKQRLVLIALLACLVWPAGLAAAAAPVYFRVQSRLAPVRSGPGTTFAILGTAARNQTLTVLARTADTAWLQVSLPGSGRKGWIKTSLGLLRGDARGLPVAGSASAPVAQPATTQPSPTASPQPPAISTTGPGDPVVAAATARARAIFQAGLALGNIPQAFSKVGDCQSLPPFFLAAFDSPDGYRLGDYAGVQDTVDNFRGSFSRSSLAAMNGLNTAGVLSPLWASPQACAAGETPLACEYRLHRPSFAFISLGTNGAWQSDADYEAGLRRIIDYSIDHGVVPILSTKADNVEGGGRFNLIMARLAGEYDLPLWNFWLAVSGLPNFGIVDRYHLGWTRPFYDEPAALHSGWGLRNLTALQSLDSVWKGVR